MDFTEPLMGELKKENQERMADQVKSVSLLKGDFIQRLPEKVKCGVDPEGLDLSSAKGLLRAAGPAAAAYDGVKKSGS